MSGLGSADDQRWLEEFIADHGGLAGSVHRQDGADLRLTAAHNIPPPVLSAVAHVARGKGMAGLAQLRGVPVQTCNLQDDTSGRINPMAKLVGGQAAIALPLIGAADQVRAVVGIAFAFEGEIDSETTRRLEEGASTLPEITGDRTEG